MSEEVPDADAVLKQAFPDGLPEQDRLLLLSLPANRRIFVVQRLAAMLAADEATTTAQMDKIAASVGLKRSALFSLRRRWRSEGRSLAVIVPWATRTAGRETSERTVKQAEKAARRWLMQDASLSNGKIGRLLIKQDKVPMSLPTATKIVQLCRARASSDPSVLALAYGLGVIVDVCGVDLLVKAGDKHFAPTCVFVIERSANLVLAARLTEPAIALHEQFAACQMAAGWLQMVLADRELPSGPATRLLVTLAPDDGGRASELVKTLAEPGSDVDVRNTGKRRFGERVRSNLGPTFGPLRLLADWPETREVAAVRRSGRTLSMTEARQLLKGLVEQHNKEVFIRLEAMSFFAEQRIGSGAMGRSLEAFARLGLQ